MSIILGILGQLVPVEMGVILRRLSQLTVNLFIDRKSLNKSELFGVLLIVSAFGYFAYKFIFSI